MSIYDELKGWQSGIGALLGLVALAAGALLNFQLNRKRDAAIRKEEARSVAAALYGEIVLLRKEVAILARNLAAEELKQAIGLDGRPKDPVDIHFIDSHRIPEAMLFQALASRIGLLDADLVTSVTEFHKNLQEARTSLLLLLPNKERGYRHSTLRVLVPARDAVVKVVPALNKIRKFISLAELLEPVDLGKTESYIEFEQSQFQ